MTSVIEGVVKLCLREGRIITSASLKHNQE